MGSKEVGLNFDTAMLIYRHWAIMVYSEKLLDKRALMKHKKLIQVLHYNCISQHKGKNSSVKGSILTELTIGTEIWFRTDKSADGRTELMDARTTPKLYPSDLVGE